MKWAEEILKKKKKEILGPEAVKLYREDGEVIGRWPGWWINFPAPEDGVDPHRVAGEAAGVLAKT